MRYINHKQRRKTVDIVNKVNTMFWLNDNSVNELNKRYGHRCYTFKTEGRIVYDPTRGKKTDPHWCIIELDKEITRYYRYLFKKRFGYDLYSPSFDAHVSLLKGFETPKMSTEWKRLDGKIVEILVANESAVEFGQPLFLIEGV